jgi:Uri superfamily endonuclease
MTTWVDEAERLPALPGAYTLCVVTRESIPHPSKQLNSPPPLSVGTYVYLGSARGPGGIRARCARHLRRDKSRRWHVDHLTADAVSLSVRAAPFPKSDECGLCARLAARPDLAAPVPGFGNSDCRTCESHLFRILGDTEIDGILEVLSGS